MITAAICRLRLATVRVLARFIREVNFTTESLNLIEHSATRSRAGRVAEWSRFMVRLPNDLEAMNLASTRTVARRSLQMAAVIIKIGTLAT